MRLSSTTVLRFAKATVTLALVSEEACPQQSGKGVSNESCWLHLQFNDLVQNLDHSADTSDSAILTMDGREAYPSIDQQAALAGGKDQNRIEVEFLHLRQFVRETSETKKGVL